MATVPSQSTAAVGNLVSATLWNDDVRDAVDFLLNPPFCRLYHSASSGANTSTYTAHPWNGERYDTDGMHSTSTNNTRITIVTTGIYQLSGAIAFAANATGQRRVVWYANGSALNDAIVAVNTTASGDMVVPAATITTGFTAGDYIELMGWQNSGGSLNMNPGSGFTSFAEARWVAEA